MDKQEVIEGWRGMCVQLGLGSPLARAFTAATLAGACAYALKYPKAAFREDGSMRPHPALSLDADATTNHFLLTPLAVGGFVFLFT